MEDQSSLLQGTMQEDSFDLVMRGYNKRQVDDYVLQCQHHIRDLAQRLALAEQENERVRADAVVAIERAASKPVHEEVSERMAQILRLANEEAERERANAADEIATLRAQALGDTQNLREQAQRETEGLRQQAIAETDAVRDRVKGETEALRQRAEAAAAEERERARLEADRVLNEARAAADRDVAQARAQAADLEETARAESERLLLAAQQRADGVIGEADRRATAINTVLGGRLQLLTTTHADVVARLIDLHGVLVDVLGREEAQGPFEVPPPPGGETLAVAANQRPGLDDPYIQTAGEVAAAYEAAAAQPLPEAAPSVWGPSPDPVEASAAAEGGSADDTGEIPLQESVVEFEEPAAAPSGASTQGRAPSGRRLDLSSVAERSRR